MSRVDTVIRYIEVYFTFGLPDYLRYIEEFAKSKFVISRFYSIHFTVILAGTGFSFVISRTSLNGGSLNRGSTVQAKELQGHPTRNFDEISVRESLLVLRLSDNALTKSA